MAAPLLLLLLLPVAQAVVDPRMIQPTNEQTVRCGVMASSHSWLTVGLELELLAWAWTE